jgi:predicted DNA-binding protein (UPF0251 family)
MARIDLEGVARATFNEISRLHGEVRYAKERELKTEHALKEFKYEISRMAEVLFPTNFEKTVSIQEIHAEIIRLKEIDNLAQSSCRASMEADIEACKEIS